MSELIDPSLSDLAFLVRVVETGGFTAASRATGIPQATISRRISQLENRLGLRLLDRTTRRVALTEPGRRVFDHARAMLDQAEAAQSVVASLQAEPAGRLSVVAPIILGQAFVSRVVADFMAHYPKVDMTLEWTTRSVHPLDDGIDIVVQVGRPKDSSAILTRLGDTRVRLFAPPGFDTETVRVPGDLGGWRVAALGRDIEDTKLAFHRGETSETVVVPRAIVANDTYVTALVAERMGTLALLPLFAAPEGWREVLPDWQLGPIELNALTAPGRGSLPKVRLFLDALRLCIGTVPD